MARPPAAWTRTPLQTLSTAPTRAPRLPADRRPAYRPRISEPKKKKRKRPAPRRVPPRVPDRADRTSGAAVERFKTSPVYAEALVRARLSREIQERKAVLAKRPAQRNKILGVIPSPIKEDEGRPFRPQKPGSRSILSSGQSLSTKGKNLEQLAELAALLREAQKSKRPAKVIADAARDKATLKQQKSSIGAPIVKAAEFSLRPTNASAGAASAILRGKGPVEAAKAVGRGLSGKEKKTYSTVLKEQGVGGGVGATVGFALDMAADPLTYVSFGAGSAARRGALKEAQQAAKRAEAAALEAGLSKTQARLRAIQARDKELARATQRAKAKGEKANTSGVTVRVAGKAVPGVERATGTLRHGARRGRQKVTARTPQKVRRAGENVRTIIRKSGSELNANVRPVSERSRTVIGRDTQLQEKALRREARSEQQQITRNLHEKLNAMRGYVSKGEMRQLIDAIEAGDLKSLKNASGLRRRDVRRLRTRGMHKDPDRLVLAAKNIEADLKYLNRLGRRSGAITGQVGKRARSRAEVALSARETQGRSTATTAQRQTAAQQELARAQTAKGPQAATRLEQAQNRVDKLQRGQTSSPLARLGEARKEQRQARSDLAALPKDAKPSQRQAARRKLRHADDRVEFLRKRLQTQTTQNRLGNVARTERKEIRQTRRKEEARGYFPRVQNREIQQGGLLERLASAGERSDIPYASTGAANPNIAPNNRRELRAARKELRSKSATRPATERMSEDIRPVLSTYAASVARGTSASNLNTKLIDDLGVALPKNPTKQALHDLENAGYGIYRVRRGEMERLDPERHYGLIVNASKASKTPHLTPQELQRAQRGQTPSKSAGGRVRLIQEEQLQRVRKKDSRTDKAFVQATDSFQRGWKGIALSTPGYLVRNLFGDTYNAYSDERAWRLLRNQARSGRVLGDLAKTEKAHRNFNRQMPESKRTVKLTDQQAAEIAAALKIPVEQVSNRVKASAIAGLAEEMGVIRQGRFVELMEDAPAAKPRGSNAWKDASKRVEDQTRLATFLGGLQRGMNPRDAADRASKIHFDYGDLTDFERNVLRRWAPFYTFPARNIPHQAKSLVRRPGKFAAVAKVNEEGRRAAGLSEDYAEGLNPYEQKQLGVPIKWGDKTFTVSLGLPFTDLNDVIAVGAGLTSGLAGLAGKDIGGDGFTGAGEAAFRRFMETGGPAQKTPLELLANYSFFYRDEISPEKEPYTRAPEWAIKAAQAPGGVGAQIRKNLGLVDDYLPPDAPGKVWGWPRKVDYAFRQGQPGPVGAALDFTGLGVKGSNARNMSQTQRALAFFGLRSIEYKDAEAKLQRFYDRREQIQTEMDKLARRSGADPNLRGTSTNATPAYERYREELSGIEEQINALQKETRAPVGGLVQGERVSREAPPTGRGRQLPPPRAVGGGTRARTLPPRR